MEEGTVWKEPKSKELSGGLTQIPSHRRKRRTVSYPIKKVVIITIPPIGFYFEEYDL